MTLVDKFGVGVLIREIFDYSNPNQNFDSKIKCNVNEFANLCHEEIGSNDQGCAGPTPAPEDFGLLLCMFPLVLGGGS